MSVLKEVKLGNEGRDFIRKRLAKGKTLSRFLLQYCDLRNGEVVTYLPGDISDEEARRFSTGGKLRVPQGSTERVLASDGTWLTIERKLNTDTHLAGIIRDFLGKNQPLCLFEDAKSRPTDPGIQREDGRIKILDDEVYFALGKRDAVNEEKIARTIKDAYSIWHFLCVMSSLPEKVLLSVRGRSLTEDDVKALAEGAERIAVGAYDGEGYLVWDKDYRG